MTAQDQEVDYWNKLYRNERDEHKVTTRVLQTLTDNFDLVIARERRRTIAWVISAIMAFIGGFAVAMALVAAGVIK